MTNPYEYDDASHSVPDPTPVGPASVTPVEPVTSHSAAGPSVGLPWKSLLGFLAVLGGQLWARAVVNGIPVLPDTVPGWVALIGGAFVAAVGIYLKSNIYTLPQANDKVAKAVARAA